MIVTTSQPRELRKLSEATELYRLIGDAAWPMLSDTARHTDFVLKSADSFEAKANQ